jgi:ATP-dependent exoDNAse (exonuclease V) alpha subunit
MLDELKDIERELDRLKRRVRRMISLLEKRRVRLSQLSNEELLSEVGSRTMPATDIAELLAAAEENQRKKR